jgi:hypothetical protein
LRLVKGINVHDLASDLLRNAASRIDGQKDSTAGALTQDMVREVYIVGKKLVAVSAGANSIAERTNAP